MKAIVVTVSDSCFCGERVDASGPAVVEVLRSHGFDVSEPEVVSDDADAIVAVLESAAGRARLVVTTGGTGIALRDATPEATRRVVDRVVDGFAEQMRAAGLKETKLAPLSRAITGTRGSTLIVNVPGSPRGAVTSLNAVMGLIPHALALLEGNTAH